ncbi:hypothetical protein MTO96_015122 [Rhipicephalus appendiculatus]
MHNDIDEVIEAQVTAQVRNRELSPDDDEQLRETESYTVVLRTKLGSHSFVLGAQVKAVDPSVECEPGSTTGYVEFKLTRFRDDSMDGLSDTFKRHVMLAWWAQCRLAGVPRALCGFRNDRGNLVSVEDIDVNSMPEMAGLLAQRCPVLRLSYCESRTTGSDDLNGNIIPQAMVLQEEEEEPSMILD